MKTKLLSAAVFAFLIFNFAFSTFGQGALTPPGAPAPTMRTLDQLDAKLEKRTPITSAPFTITQSGSYYLTTNLTTATNGIIIVTNGVTLDLNGFTISSSAGAPNGYAAILFASPVSDVSIFNGHIRGGVTNNGSGVYGGTGFSGGIDHVFGIPVNIHVSGVSVSGCLTYGINLATGDSTVVEACTIRTVGTTGISASTIKNSAAVDCGHFGIYGDQVSDCRGQSTAAIGGGGLTAIIAQNCYGQSTGGGTGLYAFDVATGCRGVSNTGLGLYAFIANSCRGTSTSGTALTVTHNVNSFFF